VSDRAVSDRSRRGGQDLERVLYEATLTELVERGYAGTTMEGVAARARTGKAALYRRWPSKRELVLAALRHHLPPLPTARRDRSARQNLTAALAAHCAVLSGETGFPGIQVMGQVIHDPELRSVFAEELIAPRLAAIDSILLNGVLSGEIDSSQLSPLSAKLGPALVVQHFLLYGSPPSSSELELIVGAAIGPRTQP
jgi:AcrR family transcriptional regulator